MAKKPITIYRIVRIDAEYDPEVLDEKTAEENAVAEVMEAAASATGHKDNDLHVTDVTDCGESA